MAAFSGICFWILISQKLPSSSVAEGISRNALAMFCLQYPFSFVLTGLIVVAFRLSGTEFNETVVMGILYSCGAIVCLFVVGELTRRWCPFVLGEKRP